MQLLPPMSPETGRIQIAHEGVDRVPSNGGKGMYAQRPTSQRSSSLKRHEYSEKGLGDETDDRDLKKAQVRHFHCSRSLRTRLTFQQSFHGKLLFWQADKLAPRRGVF